MHSAASEMSRRSFLGTAGRSLAIGAVVRSVMAESPAAPSQSDRKIRIGVVGGGFGSAFFWHEHPNCVVRAVSDLRTDRREGLMKTYRCERSYESLEKLILDKDIEAVAIFTGVPDHARHCVAALN